MHSAVSIVIPAYNEGEAIAGQIEKIQKVMQQSGHLYEVIVVDDGSTDETAETVRRYALRLIQLPSNQGYGAALQVGIAASQYERIAIIDADGTYPAEVLPDLLEHSHEYDMVVGARIADNVKIPLVRQPAKWVLRQLASYLTRQPIPDLNSGLRVFNKTLVEEFRYLFPSGFSFTTTITLVSLCNGYRILYYPINYEKRIGSSKLRLRHAHHFLLPILRIVIFFHPLRVFFPIGAIIFLCGFSKLIYDIWHSYVSDSALMSILTGTIIWTIGLCADQVAHLAKELRLNQKALTRPLDD